MRPWCQNLRHILNHPHPTPLPSKGEKSCIVLSVLFHGLAQNPSSPSSLVTPPAMWRALGSAGLEIGRGLTLELSVHHNSPHLPRCLPPLRGLSDHVLAESNCSVGAALVCWFSLGAIPLFLPSTMTPVWIVSLPAGDERVSETEEGNQQQEVPGHRESQGTFLGRAEGNFSQCLEQGQAWGNWQSSERLLRNHSREQMDESFICGKGYRDPTAHHITPKEDKHYLCLGYGKGFFLRPQFKPTQCLEGRNCLNWKSTLITHQAIHTGERPHKCLICGKSFVWRSALLRHQRKHTGERPHKCLECGKSFVERSGLAKHQIIHTGEKSHKCLDCGKSFTQRSNLMEHQRIHTGDRPHKCLDCGKSFIQRSALLKHQAIHTGERPHKCLICEKSFIQKSTLLIHQAIHTGERPHKCLDCGKSFIQRSALLIHQAIHTGVRPHKCLICGRGFIRRSDLVKHEEIHTGERPHKCLDCGKSFVRRSNLLVHQKIHTGERLHQCLDCGKSFIRRSDLVKHQAIHTRGRP
uniref:C2H2-type domain-containing protein n=1 Tax=Terrapene triunguis TaxID=2587831 RepID=A0A674JJC8_9SAUR